MVVYHDRQSIRLKNYNYADVGNYFITICSKDRENLFGSITNSIMSQNEFGIIAEQVWKNIPNHFPNAKLDECVVMPNHIHGIINIVGVQNFEPLKSNFEPLKSNFEPLQINHYQHIIKQSIGSIVRSYKSEITKYFHNHTDRKTIWQRNFYEHIIRNEQEYFATKTYIKNNVKHWENDKFHT